MGRAFRRTTRGDRGGGADFVGFIILFPLVLMPFLFAVQVFLFYQTQSAVYSASYMTLRAAETYYAETLDEAATQAELKADFLDANLEGQGYPASAATGLEFRYEDGQFFHMYVEYEVPIRYLTTPGSGWNLWGVSTDPPTLPVRVTLLGRKVFR